MKSISDSKSTGRGFGPHWHWVVSLSKTQLPTVLVLPRKALAPSPHDGKIVDWTGRF